MRVTLGVGVTRAGVDETITGLWTFANVLGLLSDIIGERTAAAGVTVDGLLIKDAGIPEAAVTAHEAALAILESQITPGTLLARLADAETVAGAWTFDVAIIMGANLNWSALDAPTKVLWISDVTGDTVARFLAQADGKLEWGDGAAARDTNLFRAAASQLATDDGFRVGGALEIFEDLLLSDNDIGITGSNNNFSVASRSFIKVTPTNASTMTGISGGVDGRLVIIYNVGSFSLTVSHENGSSTAANRVITSTGSDEVLIARQSAILVYDGTASRWRQINFL